MTRKVSITWLSGLLLALGPLAVNATLISSYDFDTGLGDTLGTGPDLVADGGTVGGGRYTFGTNQGLSLSAGLADTSNYAIEMKFQQTSGHTSWRKLVDFENLGSDLGLYINDISRLSFWTGSIGGGVDVFPTGSDQIVSFSRNGTTDEVQASLNGVLQWSFIDSTGQALSSLNLLRFFEDDFMTGENETFAGSVDYIRIYSGPATTVPEPGTLLLLGLGLAGMGATRRRKDA